LFSLQIDSFEYASGYNTLALATLINFISDKNIAHLTRWKQINLFHVKYAIKPLRKGEL
jgi:hypothetical protein